MQLWLSFLVLLEETPHLASFSQKNHSSIYHPHLLPTRWSFLSINFRICLHLVSESCSFSMSSKDWENSRQICNQQDCFKISKLWWSDSRLSFSLYCLMCIVGGTSSLGEKIALTELSFLIRKIQARKLSFYKWRLFIILIKIVDHEMTQFEISVLNSLRYGNICFFFFSQKGLLRVVLQTLHKNYMQGVDKMDWMIADFAGNFWVTSMTSQPLTRTRPYKRSGEGTDPGPFESSASFLICTKSSGSGGIILNKNKTSCCFVPSHSSLTSGLMPRKNRWIQSVFYYPNFVCFLFILQNFKSPWKDNLAFHSHSEINELE